MSICPDKSSKIAKPIYDLVKPAENGASSSISVGETHIVPGQCASDGVP